MVASSALPALLAACASDDSAGVAANATTTTTAEEVAEQARKIVGDVIDFSLTSDEWTGTFGFVTMKLHKGSFGGKDVHYVRTDTSDDEFAKSEELVFVPKLTGLSQPGRSGEVYLFENDDQAAVFSSEPGQSGYTPAWTVHRAKWVSEPKPLASVAEIDAAVAAGALSVERTNIVVNYSMVKWSTGSLPVDTKKDSYFGTGQVLEEPDTTAGRVSFKLSECYPGNRYFVVDHSIKPAAEMTSTAFSPGLHKVATEAGATGRTNVFMNGVEGPGPMGFQPSVFDFSAGEAAWSPYWDHFAYKWTEGAEARLIVNQADLFAARDAGDLEEFAGVPDTNGEVFTVNCPVPVLAPNTFRA